MGNAVVLNIYEKTIVIEFTNIEEHYLITNPKNLVKIHSILQQKFIL
ncbi:hypothetical protein [Hydrocoleum sp. CS-953]|nr:hypothetical protein [Hydrocoleum sp. CS-953]